LHNFPGPLQPQRDYQTTLAPQINTLGPTSVARPERTSPHYAPYLNRLSPLASSVSSITPATSISGTNASSNPSQAEPDIPTRLHTFVRPRGNSTRARGRARGHSAPPFPRRPPGS
jgi:hypothetical protein